MRIGAKPIMAELAACLCAALADESLCYCGVIAGMGIPIDYVDECAGVGYVRLVTGFPSLNFPQPDAARSNMSVLGLQIAVGVLRPGPSMDEEGNIESSELAAISDKVLGDFEAIRQAIRCCFGEKFEDVDYIMAEYTPIEEPSVAGGEWLLTVQEGF
jgi:hypothetical protein